MEEGVQYLAVTSNLEKAFSARFHGVEYFFKPGKAVNMPLDAVAHVFGFGADDKTRALHRLGWLTLTNDMEAALEKLNRISFMPIEQVFELRSTRPRKRRAALTVDGASSISDARLPVNADESEGEGLDSPDESEREASGQDF
jgi:hypothetical protein